jgi:hypothetical protein
MRMIAELVSGGEAGGKNFVEAVGLERVLEFRDIHKRARVAGHELTILSPELNGWPAKHASGVLDSAAALAIIAPCPTNTACTTTWAGNRRGR